MNREHVIALHAESATCISRIKAGLTIFMQEWLEDTSEELYHGIDDFVCEMHGQVAAAIYDEDKQHVIELQGKVNVLANKFYSYESCWNPRLSREITKVIGHDYTVTEWITTQLCHYADYLGYIAKDMQG